MNEVLDQAGAQNNNHNEPTGNTPEKSKEKEIDLSELESIIPDEVGPIISSLPNHDRITMIRALVGVSIQKSWRGPIPDPETLKGYNSCFEGGSKAVFDMAKSQSEHRMSLEKKVVEKELIQSGRGQYLAFTMALVFLLVAGFLIYTGHDTAGTVLGTIDIVALVTVFIVGKEGMRRDISNKKEIKPPKTNEDDDGDV